MNDKSNFDPRRENSNLNYDVELYRNTVDTKWMAKATYAGFLFIREGVDRDTAVIRLHDTILRFRDALPKARWNGESF